MTAGLGSGFLERMAVASRARARAARRLEPEARLLARAEAAPPPPPLRLAGFDLIAELKLRSPAEGSFGGRGFDRARQLEAYARAGVACVSVLTEPEEFHGSLAHLSDAAAALAAHAVPVMRKDFLTDPYQVFEARAAGAAGVLVIVTMLEDAEVRELVGAARDCGLFVLLEAFDAQDLERFENLGFGSGARGSGLPHCEGANREPMAGPATVLAGVNCRNLKTLQVDFARFAELAPSLPPGLPAVAESGIKQAADAAAVGALGYRLALVGSSLMQAADPCKAAAELLAGGRGAVPAEGRRETASHTGTVESCS